MSNYTYHGTRDLIAMPERSVQTYPSGLVRVERSFMCRKTEVARYRNTFRVNEPMPFDDGAPAIDGLFIFPEPQQLVRDDGFVEFQVTAYGRNRRFDESLIEKSSVKSSFDFEDTRESPFTTSSLPSINETYTMRGVVSSDFKIENILIPPNIENPNIIVLSPTGYYIAKKGTIKGGNYTTSRDNTYTTIIITSINVRLDSYNVTSFGLWDEVVIRYIADGHTRTTIDQLVE